MIPAVRNDLRTSYTEAQLPTRTLRLQPGNGRIGGYTDGRDAMKQAIYIILNVERYSCLIHSWNFGVRLKDLFGKPVSYCISEIRRRISDALLSDSRIQEVRDFSFEAKRGKISVTFTADTIFGEIGLERTVDI